LLNSTQLNSTPGTTSKRQFSSATSKILTIFQTRVSVLPSSYRSAFQTAQRPQCRTWYLPRTDDDATWWQSCTVTWSILVT